MNHPMNTVMTNPDSRWNKRKVLITGGTSGTGMRAAEKLLGAGADVVVVGRDRGRADEALARLEKLGGSVAVAVGDCADYEQAERVVHEAVSHLAGLDVVISAGARGKGDPKPFETMASDEIRDGLMTRFLARVQPVHAAIPHLRGRPGASVVLLTTDAGRHATSGETIVGAYAAAVIQFTKTLARELSRDEIRVNAISMTLTSDTEAWNSIFAGDDFQRKVFEKALSRFPFGEPPTSSEVADAVVFLASAEASQITGQTISVNGGLSFGGW